VGGLWVFGDGLGKKLGYCLVFMWGFGFVPNFLVPREVFPYFSKKEKIHSWKQGKGLAGRRTGTILFVLTKY